MPDTITYHGVPRSGAPALIKGFTLLELMIVVAVISILASIAVPSYLETVLRGQRSDAKIALTEMAGLMEKVRNQSAAYPTNFGTGAGQLNYFTVSLEGHYNLNIDGVVTTANFYAITATARGSQIDDEECKAFRLTATGVRSAIDKNDNNSPRCWAR